LITEIGIRNIQNLVTRCKYEEDAKGDLQLVAQVSFKAVVDPSVLAQIHRLGKQKYALLNVGFESQQAELDIDVTGRRVNLNTGEVMRQVAREVNSGAMNRDGITCTMEVGGPTRTELAVAVADGLAKARERWDKEDGSRSLHDRIGDDLREAGAIE
jgi:hypothetical protein